MDAAATCESTPPRTGQASRFGLVVWLAFVLAQVADGVLTYIGVGRFGIGVEANPLIASYIAVGGAGVALFGAKAFALGCGTVLHLQAMHRSLAAITALYFGAAVCGWASVLWPW